MSDILTDVEMPADIVRVAMMIAADIPSRVAVENRGFAARVIARAIMAERERCAGLLDEESYAMRDQRDEMIEHGTLGGRQLPETVKKLALIERRALFEGYATMADHIRKGAT